MQSFEERVADTAITYAQKYKEVFLDYEYLLCSKAFLQRDYYIISAHADNYRHLLGVTTQISAEEFFEKCITGTLEVGDFSFVKQNYTELEVRGTVRKKIKAMPDFVTMMEQTLMAQENFTKNSVHCTLATTDRSVTVGFVAAGKVKPKSLLRGDKLDASKSDTVDLILRKNRGSEFFSEIICGDRTQVEKYYDKIEALLSPELRKKEAQEPATI